MLILPALDIYAGKCVRLRQGSFAAQTVYSDSPEEVAKTFRDHGLSDLHLVDLEGAEAGRVQNWRTLESILSLTGIRAQVGGGIRRREEIERLLAMEAARVIVGSVAVKEPELVHEWIDEFGPERIVIALDLKDDKVAYGGWLKADLITPDEFISRMVQLGARTFICTDINRDGMMIGPNFTLYNRLLQSFPDRQLIASGGVSGIEDIQELAATNITGVVVGKAIYEGTVTLAQLRSLEL